MNDFTLFLLGVAGGAMAAAAGVWLGLVWYLNRGNDR